jgi:hypothetical protein
MLSARHAVSVTLAVLCFSCAAIDKRNSHAIGYRDHLVAGRCEAAGESFRRDRISFNDYRFFQSAVGHVAYLGTVPVTLYLDVFAMQRCRYGCLSETSFKGLLETLFSFSTNSYEAMKELRCPDTSYYILQHLEVAECFERRGDLASLEESLKSLQNLEQFYSGPVSCLRVKDLQVIQRAILRLKMKLTLQGNAKVGSNNR